MRSGQASTNRRSRAPCGTIRRSSIRSENLALIKRTAEELGYRPDPAGRSLKASRSYALGAVVPSLQNQIHAQIVEGAQSACLAAGYSLLVVNAEPGRPQRELYRQLVEKHRVEGLLVLTLQNEAVELPELTALGVPVVMVNRRSEGFGNFVVVAERAGGELATSYLIDIGHRRIAHLSGEIGRFNAGERFQGYRDALEKAGIAYDPDLVEPAGYSFEQGAAAMERLLDRCQGRFTAVFVVTLLAAAGAISVLRKRGVAVPGRRVGHGVSRRSAGARHFADADHHRLSARRHGGGGCQRHDRYSRKAPDLHHHDFRRWAGRRAREHRPQSACETA